MATATERDLDPEFHRIRLSMFGNIFTSGESIRQVFSDLPRVRGIFLDLADVKVSPNFLRELMIGGLSCADTMIICNSTNQQGTLIINLAHNMNVEDRIKIL